MTVPSPGVIPRSATPAPVSVIIPTWRRPAGMLTTLSQLFACIPPPAEVIVHVDAGDDVTAPAIAASRPDVRVIVASTPLGPGGLRNRLMAAATNEVVVSLDDDSFPVDGDFFSAVVRAFEAHPDAGVIAMAIIHDGEPLPERGHAPREAADFVGCGCAYRRTAFAATAGYVPLNPAYGMEEADLALQLIDHGFRIIHVDDLRIRHATDRSHQAHARIVAAHVQNTLLLAALRYPPRCWPLGLAQFANRIAYSARRGSVSGVLRGIVGSPRHVLAHLGHRAPVRAETVFRVRSLRRSTSDVRKPAG